VSRTGDTHIFRLGTHKRLLTHTFADWDTHILRLGTHNHWSAVTGKFDDLLITSGGELGTQIFRLGTHNRLLTHKFADWDTHILRLGSHNHWSVVKGKWDDLLITSGENWGHTDLQTGDTQTTVDTQICRLGTHLCSDWGHTITGQWSQAGSGTCW